MTLQGEVDSKEGFYKHQKYDELEQLLESEYGTENIKSRNHGSLKKRINLLSPNYERVVNCFKIQKANNQLYNSLKLDIDLLEEGIEDETLIQFLKDCPKIHITLEQLHTEFGDDLHFQPDISLIRNYTRINQLKDNYDKIQTVLSKCSNSTQRTTFGSILENIETISKIGENEKDLEEIFSLYETFDKVPSLEILIDDYQNLKEIIQNKEQHLRNYEDMKAIECDKLTTENDFEDQINTSNLLALSSLRESKTYEILALCHYRNCHFAYESDFEPFFKLGHKPGLYEFLDKMLDANPKETSIISAQDLNEIEDYETFEITKNTIGQLIFEYSFSKLLKVEENDLKIIKENKDKINEVFKVFKIQDQALKSKDIPYFIGEVLKMHESQSNFNELIGYKTILTNINNFIANAHNTEAIDVIFQDKNTPYRNKFITKLRQMYPENPINENKFQNYIFTSIASEFYDFKVEENTFFKSLRRGLSNFISPDT